MKERHEYSSLGINRPRLSGGDTSAYLRARADQFGQLCAASEVLYVEQVYFRHCESEIERLLLVELAFMEVPAFFTWGRAHPYPRAAIAAAGNYDENAAPAAEESFVVHLQAPVCGGKYRADFLIDATFGDSKERRRIVIEADGHDYHERTKEQAKRDRRRDREMTAAGYQVFRFTGSEIYRDAALCIREIERFLTAQEYSTRK